MLESCEHYQQSHTYNKEQTYMIEKKKWHSIRINTDALLAIHKAKDEEIKNGKSPKTDETASRLILAGAAK